MCCGAERRSWRKSTHRCLLDENYFTNKFPVRSGIWFYAAACFSLFHFFFAHSPRRLCYVWCVLCLSQHIKGARNAARVYGAFDIGPKRFKFLCFWESFSDCVSSACAGVSVKFIKFFLMESQHIMYDDALKHFSCSSSLALIFPSPSSLLSDSSIRILFDWKEWIVSSELIKERSHWTLAAPKEIKKIKSES